MFALSMHNHGRLGGVAARIADWFRARWLGLAALLAPQPEPVEIDWEDGEVR